MNRKTWVSFVILVWGLVSCASDSVDVNVNLVYGDSNAPIEDFFNLAQEQGAQISYRLLYRYEGLDTFQVNPGAAVSPQIPVAEDVFITSWHLAASGGRISGNTTSVRFNGVPLNRRNLQIAIEFLFPVESEVNGVTITEFYVFAYGCFLVDDPSKTVTESYLKAQLANGIALYAGRTCGQCPPLEFQNQNNPNFTIDELNFNPPFPACTEDF